MSAKATGKGAQASDETYDSYQLLIEAATQVDVIETAVAHPCDESSLSAVVHAAKEGIIQPILVGPEANIRDVANACQLDISAYEIIDADHSHDSAGKAVGLVRSGRAEVLMKGSLHSDEILAAVVAKQGGLRTGRRISHVFLLDVPTYPEVLAVADAAINIQPDLDTKADILQNTIDLMHYLAREDPRVAILSAIETVTTKIPSTIDAAALCKMAARGQITGATIDGPLAMDNAINLEAARIKKIDSPVAGRANILLVPNLEAGNILVKQLIFLAGAEAAGLVLGASVPIVLTSRADSHRAKMASCAVAAIYAHALRTGEPWERPAGIKP